MFLHLISSTFVWIEIFVLSRINCIGLRLASSFATFISFRSESSSYYLFPKLTSYHSTLRVRSKLSQGYNVTFHLVVARSYPKSLVRHVLQIFVFSFCYCFHAIFEWNLFHSHMVSIVTCLCSSKILNMLISKYLICAKLAFFAYHWVASPSKVFRKHWSRALLLTLYL